MTMNAEHVSFWRPLCEFVDELRHYSKPDSLSKEFDISIRQAQAISLVWKLTEQKNEGITLKELAEIMELAPATVSELVESLVRKDLLKRIQNPNDRRAVLITLTDKAIHLLDESIRKIDATSGQLLAELALEEKEAFLATLGKISAKMLEIKKA